MERILKGEEFQNRYRIRGTLKTLSPLHIGTGEESDRRIPPSERTKVKKKGEVPPAVSLVMKDASSKPIIPGSALKGVLRHWLLNVLRGVSPTLASERNFQKDSFKEKTLIELDQEEQREFLTTESSLLEFLFGTPFHEGKIEIWDSTCKMPNLPAPDTLLHWNENFLTYVDTSVAIDPSTGTAVEHLLYKIEVVPSGVEFDLNVVGQNLSREELGLVLLALQGFNSTIYPIRIGARSGRGFGRMQFIPGPVYSLDKSNLQSWVESTLQSYGTDASMETPSKFDGKDAAGYYALQELTLDEQKQLIKEIKEQFIALLSGNHEQQPVR